jgi:L-rhamnose mutarotase
VSVGGAGVNDRRLVHPLRGKLMERYASCVRLRPEHRKRYLELHAHVWPEVESMLWAANIRNYTIFLRGDVLFSYYEYIGTDHAAD